MPGGDPPIWQTDKYQKWQEDTAKLVAFNTDMVIAEDMAAAGRFWVPLCLDFRGRVYGIPHFNFQREDRVRALFLFADGEPIGADGLLWLKAHVAKTANGNTWSKVEKPGDLGLDDRVAWTDENIAQLRAVGEAVLRGDDPAKISWAVDPVSQDDSVYIKDRYQFIAACVELVQALKKGAEFITRLPLTFDGTCSGLQHMCAMTRAEEGRFVNLTSTNQPDDFYSRVAFRLHELAGYIAHDPIDYEIVSGDDAFLDHPQYALDLMADPFDRALVKTPAMSFFYGSMPGTFSDGMAEQVAEILRDRCKSTAGAIKIAHGINRAIKHMVSQAVSLRDSLKKVARLLAKKNKYLRWTTPLGFPVINCCHEPEIETISVYLRDRTPTRRRVNFTVGDKTEICEKDAVTAAPANFVHSADAAHLHLVALACADAKMDLAVVHDCFGALAPRAAQLKKIIPDEFISLHTRQNMMVDLWEAVRRSLKDATPPMPKLGNLDIKGVVDNFFPWK